jgi:DNA-binding NarL/FixJ family response regulator
MPGRPVPARRKFVQNVSKPMSEMICLKEVAGASAARLADYPACCEASKPDGRLPHKFTPRQEQILHLLARGFYYKEIGAELGISPFTVRAHLHTVYRKLEVKSRARAVVKFNEYIRQP